MRRTLLMVGSLGAAIGAALAYLFDPQQGKGRRAVARDVLAGRARRVGRVAQRRGRWAASTAAGQWLRLRHAGEPHAQLDEAELAHKVESVLFRDPDIPKGRLNINAERDVVFLRGNVDDAEQIDRIVRKVESIEGVRRVVNLLHPSGVPAPT